MISYRIFLDIAIILVVGKYMGILARRLKAPQVVGEILAGLLLGPSLLGLIQPSEFLTLMAELGVIMLMFSAGLDSDIHEIIHSGPKALMIALGGVLVPLVAGTALYLAFFGGPGSDPMVFYEGLFMGCVLTATSVSITVQALRELGHLKGQVGTTILSAAIIDDVLGIIALTLIAGLKDTSTSIWSVAGKTLLFFAFSAVVGGVILLMFRYISGKHPHTKRLPVLGLAFCLAMAYVAEEWFGIADITGAYLAGLVLSNIPDAEFIGQKMDTNSYTIFGPVFFASIGLAADVRGIDSSLVLFTLVFVVVGLLTKIVGCGGVALFCGFDRADSLKIGVGMMNRGEVALIVAQKGLALGLLSAAFFTSVILLILVSAIVTPIALKYIYCLHDQAQEEGLSKAA